MVRTLVAGWYYDPSRRAKLRYWDGSKWTNDVVGLDDERAIDQGSTFFPPPGQAADGESRNRRLVLILGIALLGLLVAGFGVRSLIFGSDDGPSRDETFEALGAIGGVSKADEDTVVSINRYPQRWNATAGPLIADLAEDNLSVDQLLAQNQSRLDDLYGIIDDLSEQVLELQDDGLRVTFISIVTNYEAKLDARTRSSAASPIKTDRAVASSATHPSEEVAELALASRGHPRASNRRRIRLASR